MDRPQRRLAVGAEALAGGGTHFRVWAPLRRRVDVMIEGGPASEPRDAPLAREDGGYFSGTVSSAGPGTRYRYRLDGGDAFPDPASRFQPEGPHGPSQVVDPSAFAWRHDRSWPGVSLRGQVIYEMHVGTFSQAGTWSGALPHLPALKDTGVTLLEVMPVAEFSGRFGWGYDGVDLYAPSHLYGAPDDFRRFVDEAHGLGLGVILDVVYNHLGPDGNYLTQYSDTYLSRTRTTEWGDSINFDGEGSGPVREFFVGNARYWVQEFHLDGLRLDATQSIFDDSGEHVLAAVARAVREAAGPRATVLVAENEPQDTRLVRPRDQGGHGLDAVWNDDYHHSAQVALTGRSEAYYSDHRGHAQELLSAVKYGYLFQGQRYRWQGHRRGTPAFGLPREAFVLFLENHDQLANTSVGRRPRELTSPGRWRALTALTLLAPGTPMLFQGQEFAASAPFLYFAEHQGNLADAVRRGRREFVSQFRTLGRPEWDALLPDPGDAETFRRCTLDHGERETHRAAVLLHRDLLRVRREDAVVRRQGADGFDGAVLTDHAFVLRFFAPDGADRLLAVNLGADLHFTPAPEPLLAPPAAHRWHVLWSSEDVAYGGLGTFPPDSQDGWRLAGEAAVLLEPRPGTDDPPGDGGYRRRKGER
jgi:maltooligosyltrehalose trehalohydrolase